MAKTKKATEVVNAGHPPRRVECKKSPTGLHESKVTGREVRVVLEPNGIIWAGRTGTWGTEHVRCRHCAKRGQSSRERIGDPAEFLAAEEIPLLENLLDRLNKRPR